MPLNPSRVRTDFGRRVAEIRSSLGLTQRQLADALGHRGIGYVVRVEAGQMNMRIDSLVALANALRTSVESMFRAPVSPPPRRPGRPRKKAF